MVLCVSVFVLDLCYSIPSAYQKLAKLYSGQMGHDLKKSHTDKKKKKKKKKNH